MERDAAARNGRTHQPARQDKQAAAAKSRLARARQMSTVKTPMISVMMTRTRCQRMMECVGGARKAANVSADGVVAGQQKIEERKEWVL